MFGFNFSKMTAKASSMLSNPHSGKALFHGFDAISTGFRGVSALSELMNPFSKVLPAANKAMYTIVDSAKISLMAGNAQSLKDTYNNQVESFKNEISSEFNKFTGISGFFKGIWSSSTMAAQEMTAAIKTSENPALERFYSATEIKSRDISVAKTDEGLFSEEVSEDEGDLDALLVAEGVEFDDYVEIYSDDEFAFSESEDEDFVEISGLDFDCDL